MCSVPVHVCFGPIAEIGLPTSKMRSTYFTGIIIGGSGRHIYGGVGVLPDKDCPSRCRERQKQTQNDVALKREWIWLGFVHRRISNLQRSRLKIISISRGR